MLVAFNWGNFKGKAKIKLFNICLKIAHLTNWGRVTHICIGELTIIGSDNGLSPGWRQSIIWTNAGIFLIWPMGTNFSEILIEINTFFIQENAFENVVWKMAAICLGLNVLISQLNHRGRHESTLRFSLSSSTRDRASTESDGWYPRVTDKVFWVVSSVIDHQVWLCLISPNRHSIYAVYENSTCNVKSTSKYGQNSRATCQHLVSKVMLAKPFRENVSSCKWLWKKWNSP